MKKKMSKNFAETNLCLKGLDSQCFWNHICRILIECLKNGVHMLFVRTIKEKRKNTMQPTYIGNFLSDKIGSTIWAEFWSEKPLKIANIFSLVEPFQN